MAQSKVVPNVLVIEAISTPSVFSRTSDQQRPGALDWPFPTVRTSPKPIRRSGSAWLQRHWVSGEQRLMLCDDMGLGKTFRHLLSVPGFET